MLYKKLDKEYKLIYQLDSKIHTRILTEPEYLTIEIHVNPKAEIISITEIKKEQSWYDIESFKDYSSEINNFFAELDSMLQSNISLFDSLESLFFHTKDRYIKDMLAQMLDALNRGEELYPTIDKFKDKLGTQTITFIKNAQETSTLKEAISSISKIKKKDYEYKKKIKSAFRYPIILLASIFVAINVILFFVVPKFKELFANASSNIPIPTQIIFFISDNYWLFLLLPFVFFLAFKIYYSDNQKLDFSIENLDTTKVPIIGTIIYYQNITNFFLSIYLLIQAKYNIDVAIKYSIDNIENIYLKEKAKKLLKDIYNGEDLITSFRGAKMFDDVVIRMISSIQKSGNIQEIFYKLFLMYETKLEDKITQSIKMIEPIIVLLFSIIILFLALAIFLPLWDINQVMV